VIALNDNYASEEKNWEFMNFFGVGGYRMRRGGLKSWGEGLNTHHSRSGAGKLAGVPAGAKQ
jgi:hypothetical protein